MAETLDVDGSDWQTECEWTKDSPLTVAIFAACYQLDNTYQDVKYYVRAMKASNVRVIAGYHEQGPTHPTDTYVADDFFNQEDGVANGESVRSAWQIANEEHGVASNWAVLCYKDNYNQYYRIPGFPGNTYDPPSSDATVYRFWYQYTDPTGGQPMDPDSLAQLPLVIIAAPQEVSVDPTALGVSSARTYENGQVVVARDFIDDVDTVLTNETQRAIADAVVAQAAPGFSIAETALVTVGDVICTEVNEDIGDVPGTEVVVGKTFCYSNQHKGIRLVDNFLKVGTDSEGAYFVINKWKPIDPQFTPEGESSVPRLC